MSPAQSEESGVPPLKAEGRDLVSGPALFLWVSDPLP